MKKVLQFSLVMTLMLLLSGTVSFAQNGTVGDTKPKNNSSKFWTRIAKSQDNTVKSIAPVNDFVQVPQIIRNIQLDKSIAVVYPNFRPFPSTTTQSELSVDVSPTNEKIIFCSANTYVIGGALYGTGIYFTTNQGTNWTGYDNPPFGTNSGDPASVISLNGNFYEGYITNASGQGVSRSTDNGATWTSSVVGTVPGSNDLLDKNHMTADKSPLSPYKNRVYVGYTEFITGGANENNIVIKYSSDNGTTWSTGVNISAAVNAQSHNQGINLSTGPNGEVYAVWAVYDDWSTNNAEDAIGFNVSTDGGQTWGVAKRIYNTPNFGIRGTLSSKGSIRVSSFPSMAVDRTGGPRNGYLYVAWTQKNIAPAGSDPDIVTIRSTNGGTTWTTPVRVNDDAVSNGKDQYYNWVTVDQATGAVYHLFYDSRNVVNSQTEVYMARSIDGNSTFENIKASDHAFTPASISGLAGGYQGDYIGIAAFRNFVYPYWMDNSSGIYQGWMCKMTFGPRVDHTPLGNTENLAGPYPVRISVVSSSGLLANSVKLFWKRGTGAFADSLVMVKDTGNTWVGNIPGNGTSATYSYYVQATDTLNGTSKLPASAPSTFFSFTAGADAIAPSITHTVLPNQYRELWPATVSATITDNIGVDSAWVVYKVKSSGTLKTFKILKTADSTYQGVFNNDTTQIAIGDTLFYRIVARDISVAHNLGYNPSSTGFNNFVFIGDVVNPVVSHNPLANQGIKRWPATVKATVTDNMGVQSVVCNYKINSNGTNRTFALALNTNNEYTGVFNVDTNTVHVGDSIYYYIKAIDRSTNHNVTLSPASGYYAFKVVATNGIVLVINDEASLKSRISTLKPYVPFEDKSTLGASATMFNTVLTADNYMVDSTTFASLDITKLNNYDIVILSAGQNTGTMFDNAAKRTAIANYTLTGGKVLVEGGEVGYIYRKASSEVDINFRQNVLHDSSWSSDGPYSIKQNSAYSSFFTNPNLVPDSLAITTSGGYGRMDIMALLNAPGVVKLASGLGYSNQALGCMIGYYPPENPSTLRNITFHFAVSGLTNTIGAANLIMNAAYALRGSVTPVEMTTFTASANDFAVNLLWNTATEVNNSGFTVERKSSTTQYINIGFIPGRGTSTTPSAYTFMDKNVPSGHYTYRLKQVDFNGETHYSKEVEVNVTAPKVFSLQQNYPNPFNPSTVIKYAVPSDGFVTLSVYNILGQKVASLVNQNVKAGSYEVKFNASNLSSGIYIYKLEAGSFNATKKMMLVK